MNKESTSTSRPTFKRTLRRISMISVVITMTLIWLLLSIASVVTLKQYAQKNLELTSATMSRSLEASLVFNDAAAATETLAMLGKQGQFAVAEVLDAQGKRFAHWSWNPNDNPDALGTLVSRRLFPTPAVQPVLHNGHAIGEVRITARDSLISHFIWMSFAVLTGCILFAAFVALSITQSLHNGIVNALQNITDVVHDVKSNRNFSRRVEEERIEEFHRFGQDFNSLLDEMEEWQLKLQARNAQLMRTAMHDPLTGLANRAAFRNSIAALMKDSSAQTNSALLFLDGDDFKLINDTWGHAAGDCVLIEVANRMVEFGAKRHQSYRLGGDEFAMILYGVHSATDVQQLCAALSQQFLRPYDLHNGNTANMSLSIGFALTWENTSVEALLEQADRNMYLVKNQRTKIIS
ncbi:diguanylate cyclase DgcN [Lelliottia amnigena]|jgi:diguanylate cyclase (GGDEF)-like protein|uniref:diguanylate cyclase DgcN n=1 Tax=Lelliottia amnigena TaxID=61646 RepID=UPI0015767C91|nr:diguanylate cyclase DgcN [Lelliottia amnigena]MBL5921185.1 diguanylate cyclase DgcN [Lelliottia amnigena]MBL5932333.1 diguanylate cyclase DgcN [Lelliottia amnigena]MCU7785349.1 diguanylate cyclase DgcN [Lelliottia amnigena]NTX71530.1 diguanylate cyclase DgcN [Lelliottia amnigena]QXB21683.1 diguanylate cyclase DgcN [Lelliottia amnigena]